MQAERVIIEGKPIERWYAWTVSYCVQGWFWLQRSAVDFNEITARQTTWRRFEPNKRRLPLTTKT